MKEYVYIRYYSGDIDDIIIERAISMPASMPN